MNMLWDSTASALVEITECGLNGINEVWILPPQSRPCIKRGNEQYVEIGVLRFPAQLLPKWEGKQNLCAHK